MKKLKDLIKDYLEQTIKTKRNMTRRIYQLENDLKEARENEKYAVDQMNKYKQINKKLRRKLKGE